MRATNERPILFVGDIQGCSAELALLLERAAFDPARHRLIPVGDTINRGPDAPGVLRMLRETRAEPILGNHELALLGVWRRRVVPDWAKAGNGSAYLQLEAAGRWDADMVDVSTWPEVRTGPDWIAVHAGLHPKRRPEGTDVWYLTQVRYCDAEGREGGASAHDPLEPAPGCRPWYEHYPGPRTVIFGHWARRGLVVQERVRGLDTGCVYGGQLTGLWWPDDRLEQVQALRAYAVHDDGDDGPEGVDG